MKKLTTFLLTVLILFTITGCKKKQDDDIYIIFTNDVHCAIEDNIGYAGVAAYKKELAAQHKYVSLIDAGDFSSGASFGSLTTGVAPTKVMNNIGYDVACLGNHEFGFGISNLTDLIIKNAEFDIVACNIGYTGKNTNLLKDLNPYVVKEYGNTKVAYIGVVTPSTLTEATPAAFMEDNEFVYDFYFGDAKENFYSNLQNVINNARKEADYVIVVGHLGVNEANAPYRSIDIVQNTYDVDAIIDAHSHSEVLGETYENTKGQEVQIWQTGTQLSNIGLLVLTKDHTIEGMLINDYENKDAEVESIISSINDELNEELKTVIGTSSYDLTIEETFNDKSFRVVRSRETNLGNLCADAYRYIYNSDIGIINGGGVRSNLSAGDITLNDVLAVNPFQNKTSMIKASGQTILDMLEYSVYLTLPYTNDGENPTGEFGGFLQVSGLKFTVDTSIESPAIIKDEMFVEIDGPRRVKDVFVEKDGEWVALDPDAFYTIAGTQYILAEYGNGYTMFKDAEVLSKEGLVDSSCLIEYIETELKGIIPEQYKETQGRIIVE